MVPRRNSIGTAVFLFLQFPRLLRRRRRKWFQKVRTGRRRRDSLLLDRPHRQQHPYQYQRPRRYGRLGGGGGGNPFVNWWGCRAGTKTTTTIAPQPSPTTGHTPCHQYWCHRHPGAVTELDLYRGILCLRFPRERKYYGRVVTVPRLLRAIPCIPRRHDEGREERMTSVQLLEKILGGTVRCFTRRRSSSASRRGCLCFFFAQYGLMVYRRRRHDDG